MKKCIFDIQLSNRPARSSSKRENKPNGSWLNDRTKGGIKLLAWKLSVAFGYKTRLVALNSAIREKFSFKNPTAAHNVLMHRSRNKRPSMVVMKSLDFIMHGCHSFGMMGSRFKSSRFAKGHQRVKERRGWQMLNGMIGFVFKNSRFGASHHGMMIGGGRWRRMSH